MQFIDRIALIAEGDDAGVEEVRVTGDRAIVEQGDVVGARQRRQRADPSAWS